MNYITPDLFSENYTNEEVEYIMRDTAKQHLTEEIRKLHARAERNPARRAKLQGEIVRLEALVQSEVETQLQKVLSKRQRQRIGPEYCADCIHRENMRCGIAKERINASIKQICADAGWRTRRVSHRPGGKTHTSSSGRRRESGAKEK